MGSVRITESIERVGDVSVSTIEYEFSDSVDFLAWESDRAERTNAAVKSFVDSQLFGDHLSGESPFENEDVGSVTEIKVGKKKDKLH